MKQWNISNRAESTGAEGGTGKEKGLRRVGEDGEGRGEIREEEVALVNS